MRIEIEIDLDNGNFTDGLRDDKSFDREELSRVFDSIVKDAWYRGEGERGVFDTNGNRIGSYRFEL